MRPTKRNRRNQKNQQDDQPIDSKNTADSEVVSMSLAEVAYYLIAYTIESRAHRFQPQQEYTLAEILGETLYGDDHTAHRAVGLLFGQLAKDGLVPFSRTDTIPFGASLYTYSP